MQVAHRGLDVGVAHPRLHLDDAGNVDRKRTKSMAEIVKPQLSQAGGVECGEVAPAQGGAVNVGALTADEHQVAFASVRVACLQVTECTSDLLDHRHGA